MDERTEEKLRKYYERQILGASKRRNDQQARRMWKRPTLLSSKSQKALLRSVHSEAERELKAEEREIKVKVISETEYQMAKESQLVGSFMSWSLFDRMDDDQRKGVIMRLKERRR